MISLLLEFSCLVSSNLFSQKTLPSSEIRFRRIILGDKPIQLDSFPILESSIRIIRNGKELDKKDFTIQAMDSRIFSKIYRGDSLLVLYKILPIPRILKATNLFEIDKGRPIESRRPLKQNISNSSTTTESDEIQYSGSFVRGLTLGNNQSASVNSGFNLNLNGRLKNGVDITANLTDANIPIQPEGNSASIQEFDRIYIQLKKDSHRAILGDFDIQNQAENHFLKFDRKLQGINFNTSIPLKNQLKLFIGGTAGVTRGQFTRNVFQAEESNQGPYKLFGMNGEAFIIIIAGTERVFINGELMKRGQENDYIINYNVGEVVFTSKRLITKDLRIVVEFQYSDRNYFRYSLESHARLDGRRFDLYSQVFSENDSKNQPINANLSTSQIERLASIGNRIDSAFISSETEIIWDPTRILYSKLDTIVDGQRYTDIFRWAESPTSPVYQVIYSQVGQGKGHYRLKSSGANGSVYEWIQPVNGLPQGSYEPQILMATPKTHLQTLVGTNLKWDGQQTSTIELTHTNHDLNSYSQRDNNQNLGYGINFRHNIAKMKDSTIGILLILNQEYTSANFSPVTRYRNNEFQRDWALSLPIRNEREQSHSYIDFKFMSNKFRSKALTEFLLIPNLYSGNQSSIDLSGEVDRWSFKTSHRILVSKQGDSSVLFYRPKASILYDFRTKSTTILELGLYHELQRNSNAQIVLSPNSFYWQNYFLKLKKVFDQNHNMDFSYIYRTEQASDSSQFKEPNVVAHTFALNGSSEFSGTQSLRYILNYRRFNSALNQQELSNNYLGKLEYNGQLSRGFLRLSSVYEIKAGREQRMQLTYIKAPNGYGNYAWKDLNENGIFELNESYVSPIATENTYMRFFVVLPEYIPANEVNYTQFLWLQPKATWFGAKDFRRVLSKFSYQFRVDLSKKMRTNPMFGFSEYANPISAFQDSNLVFSRTNLFQQLSFQKNESKIGMDLEWIYIDAKNLLSNGIEGSISNHFGWRTRIELSDFFIYQNHLLNGYRLTSSEFFIDRNFKYIENQIENTLSCLINRNFRINLIGTYGFKSTGNHYALNQQGDLEIKINRKTDGIIESKLSFLNINYIENLSSPQVELAMLNGFQKGVNYIWNFSIGQKITKYLQLNLIYNGRKNTNSENIFHSGNAEVRAIF